MLTRFLLLLITVFSFQSLATPLRIAVASNFKLPLNKIVSQYQKSTNQKVTVSSASSGILYQQIKAGAPFDVFLSADENRPTMLVNEDLALKQSMYVYARGQLVFYSPNQKMKLAQVNKANNKLVIANPLHAPYGVAAKNVLNDILKTPFKGTYITSSNIASAFQIVHSGNAPAGLVSLSHIVSTEVNQNDYVLLNNDNAYIPQAAVILARTKKMSQSKQFMTYLKSKEVQNIIKQYGYQVMP
ncbi:molybdate ABC transporter substrate-binding protein [Pseudoalteromonas sp. C2R02]|uniref:molybdate ABC transporter substrate-binding protein n=1 Tax=Pseudoalteromonas sp. C2R02 TaxID=2841565 RepID=UPI001C09403D|nr:molybdate ABC transporter substrate-binding protein [Pseudoalteromonas sp. C2R02]MBU2970695.1 molybdate ABC transporter substrate-binding protein [Pseudoalteromonas sp. C2R02]